MKNKKRCSFVEKAFVYRNFPCLKTYIKMLRLYVCGAAYLKLKIYCLAFTTIILVAAFAAGSISIATSKPVSKSSSSYDSFVMEATGQAYDPMGDEWVDVTVWLSGSVKGKISKAITLHSKDGMVTVEGYNDAEALVSNAVLIPRKHFGHLMMLLTPRYYGGSKSVWLLWGRPEQPEDSTITITLRAAKVVLPFQSHPMLYSVELEGTIQLS
jgi:hypothetical protein